MFACVIMCLCVWACVCVCVNVRMRVYIATSKQLIDGKLRIHFALFVWLTKSFPILAATTMRHINLCLFLNTSTSLMLVKSISRTLYKPQAYFSRGSIKHMLIDQLKTVGDVVDITRTVFTSIPIQRSRLNKEIDIRRRNRKHKNLKLY